MTVTRLKLHLSLARAVLVVTRTSFPRKPGVCYASSSAEAHDWFVGEFEETQIFRILLLFPGNVLVCPEMSPLLRPIAQPTRSFDLKSPSDIRTACAIQRRYITYEVSSSSCANAGSTP